ncbi:hypothetical protein [Bradyrhizobium sp. ARR65]|uniref:hypothetical protein n=1 Tax=Bradyrhizobium sp. ARR65 TaxID=1040989 RepID=UPI0004678639|nr:hypothetical protein [Bradyrhizobium sp. ARR65]
MLPEALGDLSDGNCLFDAVRGSSVASAATLSVSHVGEYLNAPRVQRDRLYWAGISALDQGCRPRRRRPVAPEDLDVFPARLLDGAVLADAAVDGQVTIPQAATAPSA